MRICVFFLQTALHLAAAGGHVGAVRVLAPATKKITQNPPKSVSICFYRKNAVFNRGRVCALCFTNGASRGLFSLCGHAWWYSCRFTCVVVRVLCLCV